jgi:UDP-N-acetyl-D-glucosamine dehydrogenase
LRKSKDPDISHIALASQEISKRLHAGMLIILQSTTYPGTTEDLIDHVVREEGYEPGKDVFICFSPERVDPGNKGYGLGNTPRVVGGITPECTRRGVDFWSNVVSEVVPVSSSRVAEMVKLLENTFRASNIGLVNEMAVMCERMGIDVWEVIDAAATKPFGFMPFYPGPGIGGHCIPLDPMYLAWKAKAYGFFNRFIELAGEINGNMPRYIVMKVHEALNLCGKAPRGSSVLILGVAYKRDVADLRESPGIEILRLLRAEGARADFNDPLVPQLSEAEEVLSSVSLTEQFLSSYDCVLLVTDHSSYDYRFIAASSRLVVDTRNAFRGIPGHFES